MVTPPSSISNNLNPHITNSQGANGKTQVIVAATRAGGSTVYAITR